MTKKIYTVLSTYKVAILLIPIMLASFLNFSHADWGDYITVDNNWRVSAGGVGIAVPLLNAIEAEYGVDAKNAYVDAAKTGDWYQYRSITGFWKPAKYDPKFKAYAIPGIADPTYFLHNGVTEDEDFIYSLLGPYATAADWIAICQQYGVTAWGGSSSVPGTDMHAMVYGQMPISGYKKITKQQYLASHGAAQQAKTPAASNSSVEALKSYAGNNAEFNAYTYYTRYADLQSAVGPNGDALLKHWNQYGKAEGRVAK